VINQETDSQGLYDYLATHAIISDKAAFVNNACESSPKIQKSECEAAEEEVENNIEYIDLYNIYAPICNSTELTPRPKQYSVRIQFHSFFLSRNSIVKINYRRIRGIVHFESLCSVMVLSLKDILTG